MRPGFPHVEPDATHPGTASVTGSPASSAGASGCRRPPGVLHSVSLAKYAVAFFKISFSLFSRTFSARSRDHSICSGVTTLTPAPLSVPAAAALTQFRSVCSISPNSLAAALAVSQSLTRVTANFLNSDVYCCFGIFVVSPFMVTAIIRHPSKTKFRGKLSSATCREVSKVLSALITSAQMYVFLFRSSGVILLPPLRCKAEPSSLLLVDCNS